MTEPTHLEKWIRFWQLVTLWEHIRKPIWKDWELYWFEKCICDCWEETYIRKANLKSWHSTTCWLPSHSKVKKLNKWLRFWRLTTLWEWEYRQEGIDKHNIWFEKCVCDCWKEIYVRNYCLKRWTTTSCWCYANECSVKNNTIHWDRSRTNPQAERRFYNIWKWINQRCNDSNEYNKIWYKHYWWRWIKNTWEKYTDFKADMFDSYKEHVAIYWEANTSIDRIDVNGNYCKENCRWATVEEQMNNTRMSWVNRFWISKEDLAKKYHTTVSTIWNIFWKSWDDFNKTIEKLEHTVNAETLYED